jgi:hypothetical protein
MYGHVVRVSVRNQAGRPWLSRADYIRKDIGFNIWQENNNRGFVSQFYCFPAKAIELNLVNLGPVAAVNGDDSPLAGRKPQILL